METLSLIGIILYYTIIIVGLTYASLIAYFLYTLFKRDLNNEWK